MTAQKNFGAEFWLANASATLTKLAGPTSMKAPSLSVGTIDTTTHDSTDGVMEFIGEGVADPGTATVTFNWEPGSATDALLLEALASKEVRAFMLVANGSGGDKYELSGNAIVTGYEPDQQTVQGKQQATVSLKATGTLTWTAA